MLTIDQTRNIWIDVQYAMREAIQSRAMHTPVTITSVDGAWVLLELRHFEIRENFAHHGAPLDYFYTAGEPYVRH